jgi:hypothetical protein
MAGAEVKAPSYECACVPFGWDLKYDGTRDIPSEAGPTTVQGSISARLCVTSLNNVQTKVVANNNNFFAARMAA